MDLANLVGDRHLELTLTRRCFEDLCVDLFDKCLDQIDRVLGDPKLPDAYPPPLKVPSHAYGCSPALRAVRQGLAARNLLMLSFLRPGLWLCECYERCCTCVELRYDEPSWSASASWMTRAHGTPQLLPYASFPNAAAQLAHRDACRAAQSKVERVLLVGGASRMPKIRQLMLDYFEFPPDTTVDSDEAVMHGAAIEAARLTPGSMEAGGVSHSAPVRPCVAVCLPPVRPHSLCCIRPCTWWLHMHDATMSAGAQACRAFLA